MKVTGSATVTGAVERVYAALTDPAVLVRTIPGCERLERTGPDAYTMTVSAGVAAIKGTYGGEVLLSEQRPPNAFVLKASGAGAPGTVEAVARISLTPAADGTTTVGYDADAVIGGMVGGVGQRVLTGVARRMADEFFAAVDSALNEPASLAVPEGPSGGAAPVVFTRPATVHSGRPNDFATGVAFGALAALLGAIVGGLIGRRARKG
jgi:carbon monoxide dehydrogenase subunit G